MATKSLVKKFRRKLMVYGIGELVITLDLDGISFNAVGKPKKVFIAWPHVVMHCETPDTAKRWLQGKPVEFLKAQIAEHTKSTINRHFDLG